MYIFFSPNIIFICSFIGNPHNMTQAVMCTVLLILNLYAAINNLIIDLSV